jgi:cytochrome c peroxidase
MRSATIVGIVCGVAFASAACSGGVDAPDRAPIAESAQAATKAKPGTLDHPNAAGTARSLYLNGPIDAKNAFFRSLGGNGRACVDCHQPAQGWSITPAGMQATFDATQGLAGVFRPVDGATHPTANVATVEARRSAYKLLLSRGLVRVGMAVPANAEFVVSAIDDPYGAATPSALNVYRRPLPTANVKFLSTTMWDGRETANNGTDLRTDLLVQSNSAQLVHAEGPPLTAAQRAEIVDFELSTFFAQSSDTLAGKLDVASGEGGPERLATQDFFLGINDPIGLNPTGAAFVPHAMTLFSKWKSSSPAAPNSTAGARAAIARGAEIFGMRTFTVSGVRGVNDELGVASLEVTCTTCHDAPNIGHHSVPFPLDLGLTTAARRKSDVPLYTLRNKQTGETIQTTDPGRALVTGKWKDVARFKGPILRGVAARAPFFHDGSAATLEEVVDFYEDRFGIGFTTQERNDLLAFLRAL